MTTPLRQQLAAVLAAYHPSDSEGVHLAEMRHLAGSIGDVTSDAWFVPGHFTVSGFVTNPAITSVVLIRHRRLDRWLQPGGHIDPGDITLEATLMREIAEETGLADLEPRHPLFDIDVHSFPAHGANPAHRHYDLRFHVVAATDAPVAASADVDGAAWVPLDQVAQWTTDDSVLRSVAKLRTLRDAADSLERRQRR